MGMEDNDCTEKRGTLSIQTIKEKILSSSQSYT
jgi:hypothetical protein